MNPEANTRQQEAANAILKHFDIKEKIFIKPLKQYALLDGWFIGNGKFGAPDREIIYKVYVRRNSIDKYPSIMIESNIVQALRKEWINGLIPFYFNVFPTDKTRYKNAIIFNLLSRFEDWEQNGYPFKKVLAPEYTIGGYGKSIDKDVIYLDFNKETDLKMFNFYVPPFSNKNFKPTWKPRT
jgi:hypothetical protein